MTQPIWKHKLLFVTVKPMIRPNTDNTDLKNKAVKSDGKRLAYCRVPFFVLKIAFDMEPLKLDL